MVLLFVQVATLVIEVGIVEGVTHSLVMSGIGIQVVNLFFYGTDKLKL